MSTALTATPSQPPNHITNASWGNWYQSFANVSIYMLIWLWIQRAQESKERNRIVPSAEAIWGTSQLDLHSWYTQPSHKTEQWFQFSSLKLICIRGTTFMSYITLAEFLPERLQFCEWITSWNTSSRAVAARAWFMRHLSILSSDTRRLIYTLSTENPRLANYK